MHLKVEKERKMSNGIFCTCNGRLSSFFLIEQTYAYFAKDFANCNLVYLKMK